MNNTDFKARAIETLIDAMLEDDEVRLPGARRLDEAARAAKDGIEVSEALAKQLHELARR